MIVQTNLGPISRKGPKDTKEYQIREHIARIENAIQALTQSLESVKQNSEHLNWGEVGELGELTRQIEQTTEWYTSPTSSSQ